MTLLSFCEKDRVRLRGEDAKKQRSRSALKRASEMGKESSKKTCHKSGKVPLSKPAMVSKQNKKPPVIRKCGVCRQPGHTAKTCSMPKPTKMKRKVDLLSWDREAGDVMTSKKAKKVKLFDW